MTFHSPLPAPVEPLAPVDAVLRDAAANADRTAIVDTAGGERLSRGQLAERSATIAAELTRRGVERGEPVAVAMHNTVSWPAIALGIWRAGAVLTPLSPFWGAAETARLCALVAPRIALAGPQFAPTLRDAAAIAGLSMEVLTDPPAAPAADVLAAPTLTTDDLAAIMFSSGTSGPFKGVRLTHGNLAASAAQVAAGFALDANSVVLAGAPFFAAIGLGTALCAPLSVGARVVTVPMPLTEPILTATAAQRVTHAIVPLTVVEEIAAAPTAPAHDLSSLRLLGTGGAHIPPAALRRASRRVGCSALSGYGMTEATSMISGPLARPNDPDTVGWLAAGTDARIVDPESGRDTEPGEAGEVWIRGPQVMHGYYGDPQATRATLSPDRWLRTGDLGRMRDDGQLVLEDRIKELIKVRGRQVAPAEVELVLREHPAVRDAAVVGRPHARDGQVPVAYVVASADATPADLLEHAATRLAEHKRPHDVRIVERLPRAPSGKLLRRVLRDRARHDRRPPSRMDPFSEEFLRDPYPEHEILRGAGPVVRLERYGVWAMARHDLVHAALEDWATYRSGAGVGLADFTKEKPWRQPSLLGEADPPEHTGARKATMAALSPPRIRRMREAFEREAETLVDRLVRRGSFDAVTDLAEPYPVKVFGDAVGLPAEGRENLMAYGDMVFNAFGPRNELFEASARRLEQGVRGWITAMCLPENLDPGGIGAAIHDQAPACDLEPDEAALLVRSLLSAGVDTTVAALGNAILCFADHPDQWAALHADPTRSRAAFEEVLRYESPVQTFFRTTTREVDVEGVRIPAGEKVLLFLAAANRDPRHWDEPERFDVGRKASGHLGFGHGIHGCVGRMLARLEGEVVLAALARRVQRIERDGEPVRKLNNTLRGLARLPVRVRPG